MTTRELRVLPDAEHLVTAVVTALLRAIEARLASHARADVALTGGGVGSQVAQALVAAVPVVPVDWTRVHFWWGDERWVTDASTERNDEGVASAIAAADSLGHAVPTLHRVTGYDDQTDVHAAAAQYSSILDAARAEGSDEPFFTVILLGLGPDGHVASLFPGHPELADTGTCVGVVDSPKPPGQRVSMTLPTLNDADQVWILASGTAKHSALDALLSPRTDIRELPARGVHGMTSTIIWADASAAQGPRA